MAGETVGFTGEVVLSFRWFLESTANWAHIWPQRFKLREERRLRLFENRVLRIFGSKRDEEQGSGENYIMSNLMICTAILFG